MFDYNTLQAKVSDKWCWIFKDYIQYKYHCNISRNKLNKIQKNFQYRNINSSWFANFNIDNAVSIYNKQINDIIDKKIVYFWQRNITIFDIIKKVIRNEQTQFENEIFEKVFSDFWNRIFFKALLQNDDKKAKSVYFNIKYLAPLPHHC